MEDALEALEIWNALLRSTCPRKLVMMTVPSMAQSKRPGSTATSGYPACTNECMSCRLVLLQSPSHHDDEAQCFFKESSLLSHFHSFAEQRKAPYCRQIWGHCFLLQLCIIYHRRARVGVRFRGKPRAVQTPTLRSVYLEHAIAGAERYG